MITGQFKVLLLEKKKGTIQVPPELAEDHRSMKILILAGWSVMAASLLAMITGHLGAGHLSWISDQISTYAAVAPNGGFITASIWMSAGGLLIVGAVVLRDPVLGGSHFASISMALAGASAAGLMTLAHYKETARSLAALEQAGFWAVRIQSFHDAGLMIFFCSAMLLMMIAGVLMFVRYKGMFEKLLGSAVFALAPTSYLLMTTQWPKYIGFSGITTGVNERVALFCLWLAAAMIFVPTSRSKGTVAMRAMVQGGEG